MKNRIYIFLPLLVLFFLPMHVRAGEAEPPGAIEGTAPQSQPTESVGQRSPEAHAPEAQQPSGQSKVVVEIPRSQWCQCVRAILNVEGGNIAGCVKSGASEEKLKIFRMRGAGSGSSNSVSYLLSFAGCSESENENVGSLSFDIQWQGPQVDSSPSGTGSPAQESKQTFAPITCAAGNISSIEATLYRSSKAKLAASRPWNCSTPVTTLNTIPAGSKLRLVVIGKNASGAVLYRGEQAGITITYGQTTAAGAIAAPPFTPALTAPADADLLPSGRVHFTWLGASAASGYRIQVSENANFTPTIIDATTTSEKYETRDDLASRTFYWRVMATDAFSNSSEWSSPGSFTVDADPPNNTTVGTFINNGATMTNASTVSLAISATKRTGVAAYFISESQKKPDAGKKGWVALPSPISYSATIPYTLSKGDGVKKISVWFKDALGRVSRERSGSILLDTMLPRTTIVGRPADPTNATSASFGFSSTKKGSTFQCQLDMNAYSACTSTTLYEGLHDGTHTFTVKAVDAAGNADLTPASFTWTIDTNPPLTTITKKPLSWTNLTSASFDFSSSKPGSSFRCRLDGDTFADCVNPKAYTGLAMGPHTFMVQATDAVGNTDQSPASYGWTIDTTLFETTITSRPSLTSTSTSADFGFTSKKSEAKFLCQLDSGSYAPCTSPINYAGLTESNHTFSVKAIDSMGNEDTTPARYAWVIGVPPINTTPPHFINKGKASLTDKEQVLLSISATSDKAVAGYFVSESPDTPSASDPGWVPVKPVNTYSRSVNWTLSELTGKKRVYVWFKDSAGYISEMQTDTISRFNSAYVVLLFLLVQAAIIL